MKVNDKQKAKKVLMIAYYFPPVGGIGVQRVLKFAKYLPEYGWQPIILTVRNAVARLFDPSLLNEIPKEVKVYRTRSLEPQKIYKAIEAMCEKVLSIIDRIFRTDRLVKAFHWRFEALIPRGYLNPLFFVPDRCIGWLPFAVLKGWKIIKKEKVDVIYSTGPPHSTQLIGYVLKLLTGKPLIADFRDPWTEYRDWSPATKIHKNIEEFMEKNVLKFANKVICVVEYMAKDFIDKYGHIIDRSKFITIPNGFDADDFKSMMPFKNSKFTITYTGQFNGYYSAITPRFFLTALRRLLDERRELEKEIQVIFVGDFAEFYKKKVRELCLENVSRWTGFVPHRQAIRYMMSSDVLLLIIGTSNRSDRIIPGKTFEYLGAKKPILALVPKGSAAELVNITKSGVVVPPEDIEAIKQAIYDLFLRHKKGDLNSHFKWTNIYQFERRRLTENLVHVLNEVQPTFGKG